MLPVGGRFHTVETRDCAPTMHIALTQRAQFDRPQSVARFGKDTCGASAAKESLFRRGPSGVAPSICSAPLSGARHRAREFALRPPGQHTGRPQTRLSWGGPQQLNAHDRAKSVPSSPLQCTADAPTKVGLGWALSDLIDAKSLHYLSEMIFFQFAHSYGQSSNVQ